MLEELVTCDVAELLLEKAVASVEKSPLELRMWRSQGSIRWQSSLLAAMLEVH